MNCHQGTLKNDPSFLPKGLLLIHFPIFPFHLLSSLLIALFCVIWPFHTLLIIITYIPPPPPSQHTKYKPSKPRLLQNIQKRQKICAQKFCFTLFCLCHPISKNSHFFSNRVRERSQKFVVFCPPHSLIPHRSALTREVSSSRCWFLYYSTPSAH